MKEETGFKNVVASDHETVIVDTSRYVPVTDVGALGAVLTTADEALDVADDTEFIAVTVYV